MRDLGFAFRQRTILELGGLAFIAMMQTTGDLHRQRQLQRQRLRTDGKRLAPAQATLRLWAVDGQHGNKSTHTHAALAFPN